MLLEFRDMNFNASNESFHGGLACNLNLGHIHRDLQRVVRQTFNDLSDESSELDGLCLRVYGSGWNSRAIADLESPLRKTKGSARVERHSCSGLSESILGTPGQALQVSHVVP